MRLTTVLEKHGRVGLGGEGVLRTFGRIPEAQDVILKAVDQGIAYFDSAHVYADSELYYGTVWQECPQIRSQIFQASKSASRDKKGALNDLESTMQRMGTDYLDLWQIHDVRTSQDLETIAGPGGALEAFLEAKSSGKVRFIGVTGHHDPKILTQAVETWPVDAVMMPVNPVEAVLGGFLTQTLPSAEKKGVAVIGMKVLGGSHYLHPKLAIRPKVLIRFALSFPVTVAIVGCSTKREVETLASVGRDTSPLNAEDMARVVKQFEPVARQLAFYRGVI
jgi:aryl-alcohol dehydrogenase-like predicted oxidoreductase